MVFHLVKEEVIYSLNLGDSVNSFFLLQLFSSRTTGWGGGFKSQLSQNYALNH